jgi:PTH2 family peptidyl-tRNA hydrolase
MPVHMQLVVLTNNYPTHNSILTANSNLLTSKHYMWQQLRRIGQAVTVGEPTKQVLVVRKDLKMGVGKIAAQCSHAALGSVEGIRQASDSTHTGWLEAWFGTGCAKIVVSCASEEDLLRLEGECKNHSVPSCVVRDAGRTQLVAGTATVLAVGPGPRTLVDKITGGLKLL